MSNAGLQALTHDDGGESVERKGWTPRQIKAALVLKGISFTSLAKEAGVTPGAIAQTVQQYDNPYKNRFKGYRLRVIIAKALDVSVSEIWPD